MTLDKFFQDVFVPAWLQTCNAEVLQKYQIACDWFTIFLGKPAKADDITDVRMSAFEKWLLETRRIPTAEIRHVGRAVGKSRLGYSGWASRLKQVKRFAQAKERPARIDMRVADFLRQVYFVERPMKGHSRHDYYAVVSSLSKFNGSDVMLGELSTELVDGWFASLTTSPKHKAARLEFVRAIWRFAFELGYVMTVHATADEKPLSPLNTDGDSLRMICTSKFFVLNTRIRDWKTRHQYKIALNDFAKFLGHEPTLADLLDDNVAGMMRMLSDDRKLAPKTVNERRGRINTLWSWLAKRGYLRTFPTTPTMREPVRIPKAWTREQLAMLFKACESERVTIAGIPAPTWWRMVHVMAWVTGERITALTSVRVEWLDLEQGFLLIPAEVRKSKTQDKLYPLTPDVVEMLRKFIANPQREMLFPWPYSPGYLWTRYKIIRQRAGLPTDRKSSFHRMRRSYATHLEVAGGNATSALSHATRRVTEGYLDPTILIPKAVEMFKPWEKNGNGTPDDDAKDKPKAK